MNLKYLLLSLLSALLLSLPFFEHFSGLVLLIAFVPLLLVEDDLANQGKKNAWRWAALTFLVWNGCTTYWIMYATFWGMIGAVVATSALETLVFWCFTAAKRRLSKGLGYIAFVVFWLTWEHFFLNSEINWPWLTLGNGFCKDIYLIQWYDITGTLGGSCWALVCNALIAYLISATSDQRPATNCQVSSTKYFKFPFLPLGVRGHLIALVLLIVFPITCSLIIFYTYKTPQGTECNIAVLQPNIDPFGEKFDGMSPQQQLEILLQLANATADSTTHYVIAPETALPGIWENNFATDYYIEKIRAFCAQHPQTRFITGATTFYKYGEQEKKSYTARHNNDTYYDVYNAALQIDTGSNVGVYHKSKLVVGVEMLPYPKYMKFLSKLAINLGGSSGGLGTQRERTVFAGQDNTFRVGVAVCYESIFGEYCTEYVKNGANLLFIITNDGWWRDTPGHRQHLNYARLRAIETRRDIARSANTGISAVINQRGEMLHRTQWWVRDAFTATITTNDAITPYVRYGDVVANIAQLLSLAIICVIITKKARRKQ
ncbi:apolipoprotein N-acyltransferase [Bacteroidia bacterium]|nr:apolipoprotein N-acyltransferase [Bacteroidia bacterium]